VRDLKIAILTGNHKINWPSEQLVKEIKNFNSHPIILNLNEITSEIIDHSYFYHNKKKIEIDGGIIRGLGKASTDQITFRISLLEHMNYGKNTIINNPYSYRLAKDKYATLIKLHKNKIPVPRTFVTENETTAFKFAKELGEVVIKPLIGSRGLGPIRSNNTDLSFRIIKTLSRLNLVLYIQEYIEKPDRDIRIFVIGEKVLGGIYRKTSQGEWKTNIAVGGKAIKIKLNDQLENLAIKTAEILKLDYTGIDILESGDGYKVIEANAAPSWQGLQNVLKINVAKNIIGHLINKIKK
jgi:RimK family alpha-L-glutamate ligase